MSSFELKQMGEWAKGGGRGVGLCSRCKEVERKIDKVLVCPTLFCSCSWWVVVVSMADAGRRRHGQREDSERYWPGSASLLPL